MEDPGLSEEAARKEKKDFILDTVEKWSADFEAEALVEKAQSLHVPRPGDHGLAPHPRRATRGARLPARDRPSEVRAA